MGDIALETGHVEQAVEYYNLALERFTRLATEDPRGPDTDSEKNLARCYRRLGLAAQETQQFQEATHWFEKELNVIEALNNAGHLDWADKDWPTEVKLRLTISPNAQRAISDPEFALSRPREEAAGLLQVRASALAEQGRHAEATETAEKTRQLAANEPRNLYDVARCLSLCARAVARSRLKAVPLDQRVGDDSSQLSDSDQTAIDRYRDEAIRCLFNAIDAGWTELVTLSDPDLAPLRQHPRYGEVVERLRSARKDRGELPATRVSEP